MNNALGLGCSTLSYYLSLIPRFLSNITDKNLRKELRRKRPIESGGYKSCEMRNIAVHRGLGRAGKRSWDQSKDQPHMNLCFYH